ncbi:hypothetical protein Tco_0932466 [Tanacetum coccineum]
MLALRLHLEACTVENVVAVCGAEVGEVQLTVAKDTMLDLSVKTMELSWRSSNAQGFLPGKELYVLANGEIKSPGLLDFKVRWNSKRGPEFTWEREDQFRKKYPHLFTKTAPSSSAV